MIDYRDKNYETRREIFTRYAAWQYKTGDVDPSLWMMKYVFNRQEYNTEQVLWYIFLYANTYQLPTSFVMANEFPDYDLVDEERLQEWIDTNGDKVRYQTDCNRIAFGRIGAKRTLPVTFKAYKSIVGKNQEEFFAGLCTGSPTENFNRVWDALEQIPLFSRYRLWFYLQALRDVGGLNIDIPSLKLDDSGSESHRDGLCLALAKDEWCKRKVDGKKIRHKFTVDEINWLEQEAVCIQDKLLSEYNIEMDSLMLETVLCAFKKLFRTRDGRYCGYYLDRQAEDINKVSADNWDGIEWSLLWDARNEMLHSNLLNNSVDRPAMTFFTDNGDLDYKELFFTNQVEKKNEMNIFDLFS